MSVPIKIINALEVWEDGELTWQQVEEVITSLKGDELLDFLSLARSRALIQRSVIQSLRDEAAAQKSPGHASSSS